MKLLTKNPRRRLGAKGLEDVKQHPFFGSDVDWDAIAQKRVSAPIKPKIKDEMDTSNFADEFTRLPLTDSPGFAPLTESLFRGYSFISPTVLFGPANAVNEDLYNLLRLTNHQRPDPSQLHRLIKTSPFFQNYELIDRERFLGEGRFSICRFVCLLFSFRKSNFVFSSSVDVEIDLLRACQGHANIRMELLTGRELFYRIRTQASFSEKEASQLMRKLVSAVNFMHSNDICHPDLNETRSRKTTTKEKSLFSFRPYRTFRIFCFLLLIRMVKSK